MVEITLDNAMLRMINDSRQLSKKAFTIDRCIILLLLSCCLDGLQFRELKQLLKISDGKLIADLNTLSDNGWVKKTAEQWDNKLLDVYILSESGSDETAKCENFFGSCLKFKERCR